MQINLKEFAFVQIFTRFKDAMEDLIQEGMTKARFQSSTRINVASRNRTLAIVVAAEMLNLSLGNNGRHRMRSSAKIGQLARRGRLINSSRASRVHTLFFPLIGNDGSSLGELESEFPLFGSLGD